MNQITVIEVAPGGEAIYVDAVDVVDGVVRVDVIYPPPAISFVEVQVPGIQGPAGPAGPSGSGNWDLIEGKPDTFPPTLPIPQSGITNLTTDLAAKLNLAGGTMTGKLITKASLAGSAYFNIPPGTAPSTPVDGDVWVVGTQLFFQRTGTHTVITSDGTQTISGIKTFTAKPIMTTPAAGTASINLPHGTAPTTPVNGDFWTTTLGLYGRINGVNVGPFTSLPIAQADVTGLTAALASKADLAGATFTGKINLPSSTAVGAMINLGAAGVSPTTPLTGDLWGTNSALYYRGSTLSYPVVFLNGTQTFTGDKIFSVPPIMATPTTLIASMRLPHGTAPTAPVDGDVWTTATGMFARINGVSVGPFGPSGVADWANITNKPATFPPTLPIPSSGITGLDTALAGMVLKAGDTMTGKLNTPASTTASAGFNIAPGTGPTAPVDGDLWVVTSSLLWRGGGSTYSAVNLTGTQTISGLKTFSTQVKFFASTTALASINIPSGATPTTPVDGDFWLVGTVYSYRASGSTYNLVNVQGSQTISGIKTFSNKTTFVASATGQASILIPPGVAPSAPVDGDIWTTAAGMYVRINGAVVGPLAASGGAVDWTLVTGKPATFPPSLPIAQSGITDLIDDLAEKAPLASPGLTGVPTAPTAAPGTNTTQIASTAFAAAAAIAAATGAQNNAVLKAGDTMIGDLSIAKATPVLSIDKAASGQLGGLYIKTGGVTRWSIVSNTALESGSNVGSNLLINFHDDAGNVNSYISITRSDGKLVTKNLSASGYLQTSPASGAANVYIDRAAGQSGLINFRSGSLARWQVNCNNVAEGGADAGSNFQILRCSDAGAQIDAAFEITRATGLTTVKALTATGKVTTAASATGSAGFNLPLGVAPTTPVNGDVWTISNSLYFKGSGATPYEIANLNGGQSFTGAKTFGTKTTFFTSSTTNASIVIPHGVAPTTPVNGDLWTTSTGLFVQINGATIGPLAGSSGAADWASITGKPSTFPPDPHVHPQSDITNLVADLALKAPINSPVFTGSALTVTYTDAGAALGPSLILDRNSASALTNDLIGEILFRGRSNVGATVDYAQIRAIVNDAGDQFYSQSGLAFNIMQGGVMTTPFMIDSYWGTVFEGYGVLVRSQVGSGVANGPSITIAHYSETPAAADTIGHLKWEGNESNLSPGLKHTYGSISVRTDDVTLGSTDSSMLFYNRRANTLSTGMILGLTGLDPGTNDGSALGSGTLMWSDLFLANGGIINFNNGAFTITHSGSALAFSNGIGFGSSTAASATTLTRHLALYGTTFGFSVTSSTLNAVASGKIDLYSSTTLMVSFALAAATFSKKVITVLSATGGAGFNLPHGAAPTTPVNGDFWTETTGVYARINGATVGPLGAGGGGLADAPVDGQAYFRKSATWAATPTVTVATTAPGTPAVGDIWVDTN